MAGLVAPKAMVKVGPPLLAKADNRGSALLTMPMPLIVVGAGLCDAAHQA